jgi:hypothetical protein
MGETEWPNNQAELDELRLAKGSQIRNTCEAQKMVD